MPKNGWLPSEYQDERPPPLRDTPDAWVVSLDDGAPALASADPDGDPESAWSRPQALKDGDIFEFDRLTDHGGATLTMHADGRFAVDRRMPAGANYVRMDFDILAESVESLISNSCIAEGGHDLDYYEWSEPQRFRFDAATRRFVPASANDA